MIPSLRARLLCSQTAPEALINALYRFSYRCENSSYETAADLDLVHNDEFRVFQKAAPDIHNLLHQGVHFQHMDVGNWKLEEGEDDSWANLDPLTLSYTSLRIYQHFESLICTGNNHEVGCDCSKLMKFYGDCLFRCNYAICQYQQIAFKTRDNRDTHCSSHDRPYKCPHLSCDFSTLAFFSRDQLGRHLQNCHSNAPPKPVHLIQNPDEDELVPLLSDMIAMGMAAEVAALCPRFKRLEPSQRESLLEEAAFSGSLQIWQYLMHTWTSSLPRSLLCMSINASIKGENIEILEQAALQIKGTKRVSGDKCDFMYLGVNSESVEVFEIWKKHISGYKKGRGPMITTEYVIQRVMDPVKQERLSILLREHAALGYLTKHDLGRALRAVASTTCSISLARALLDSGADVNFRNEPSINSDNIKSPLLLAADKNNRAAAEMMRFLLIVGADPNASYRVGHINVEGLRTVGMGSEAKQIFRWLEMTWDELVEWVTEQRSNNSQDEVVSRLYS